MGLAQKVLDIVSGGLVGNIIDVAKSYFPPNMTESEKLEAEMKMMQIKAGVDLQLQEMLNETEKNFNDRIMAMDGTAEQIKDIWFVGPTVIFLRALQRPIWGVGTIILDWQVFSGAWIIKEGSRQDICFLIINLIILIFLFGERTFRNIAPLVERLLMVRK